MQDVGDEIGPRDPNQTALNSSLTQTENCVQNGCHNSAANTEVPGDTPRESALFTVGGGDVILKVPTIDVLDVPNCAIRSCDNNDTAFIRRSHSANILGHHYYHKDIIIPSVGSYNELSADSALHHASSLTAFSRDFPTYKKTYERSSRNNGKDYQRYPQLMDAKFHTVSGRREDRVFSQRDIIKSRSASNILNARNKNNLGVRPTKLNVAFCDRPPTNAGDRYYSSFYSDISERDPHRVHPCFYEGTTALVPAQESLDAAEHVTGVVFEDEVTPMKPLLKPSPQAHMSSSFEFLARFPPPPRGDKRRPSAMTTISARSLKELGEDSDSSDSSLCIGSSEESHFRPAARQRKQSVISWTADCLDLELLKDAIYVNIIVGVSFSLFSDNMFFNLQPLYYLSLEFSGPQVALCIAVNSAADLVGRLVFVLCSFCLTYKSRLLFLLASIATIVFRIVFLLTKDYVIICVMTALLGFFRSWINVCIPLIFAEFSPVDRFPAAYGLHLLTAGLVHLLIGPFVGLIRDVSGSYVTCLGTITGCLLFCVIPWIGEALFFRLSAVLKISS
ncbi:uncharacterized protein [Anabrus simplex]|uniref:uncharacterized protein n=1 Tax=Anabrus simplex TaxID=316456 RepID=UPI0035A37B85